MEVKTLRPTGDPSSNDMILDRVSTPFVGDRVEVSMPAYSMAQITFSCVNSGSCDFDDLVGMAGVWLDSDGQWDIAPVSSPDGIINLRDFGLLSESWSP